MSEKTREYMFGLSALLVLAGAVLWFTHWVYAPYLFFVGTAGVAIIFFTAPYKKLDFRHRRLQRYNIISAVLMLGASALMFNNRKEWVVILFIAAIFLLYAAFVSPKDPSDTES